MFVCFNINALEVNDFVPGFLMPTPESAELELPVKPLVDTKRNGSATTSWYCNRNPNSTDQNENVFCNKNGNGSTVKNLRYESASISGDKTAVIDNTVTGVKIGGTTSANQNTLQTPDLKNSIQKSQGGFMVPIAPNNDMNMNINQQQIQFNIKY